MTSRRETLKRADPSTIQDKVLVGYQGWFTCAGDGEPIHPGHHGWLHWFNPPIPNGGRPNVDFWPDTSEYDPSELYAAPGLATAGGDPVYLFSSRNSRTVQRHFHWMARHGVDGAFLQRFAGQCEVKAGNHGVRDLRDEVGDRVREAAEAEGRVFAIMYDVSGVSPDKIQGILEQDWMHLLNDKLLLESPSYLRERGKPVVALWGFGLNGRNHTPELVRAISAFFRSSTPDGVYLMAGTPGHWRTSTSDADRNPDFVTMWTDCFDAISPWTVGRYGNEEEADRWGQGRLKADAEYLNKLASEGGPKVDYIPVVLPGGSGFNLSEGKWRMNDMPRNMGRFLWTQIYNARRAGVRTIYGAMWDEYDEGTVFMPIVPHASQLPVHPLFRFLALDIDGEDLPSDWYMRVLGYVAEAFHGEHSLPDALPMKELQDYWNTRPRYETVAGGSGGERGEVHVDVVAGAMEKWRIAEGERKPEGFHDAPPPYTTEDVSPREPGPSTQLRPPPVRHESRPQPAREGSSVSVASPAGAAPPRVNMASRPAPPSKISSYGTEKRTTPSPGPALPLALRPGSPPTNQHGRHASQAYDPRSLTQGGVAFPVPGGPPQRLECDVEHERGRRRSESSTCGPAHAHRPSYGHSYSTSPGPYDHHGVGASGPSGGVGYAGGYMPPAGPPSGYGAPAGPPGEYGKPGGGYAPPPGPPGGYGAPAAPPGEYGAPAGPPGEYGKPGGGYAPPPGRPGEYGAPAGPPSEYGKPGGGYAPPPGPPSAYGAPAGRPGEYGAPAGPPSEYGKPGGGYAPPAPPGEYGAPGGGYAPPPGPPSEYGAPGGGYAPPPGPPPVSGYGQAQGGYVTSYQGPNQPQGGYAYGYAPGYIPAGSSAPAGNSGGKGGIQGGIASAWQAVEGLAGPQTRKQLEKTVKSLKGNTLFNKRK